MGHVEEAAAPWASAPAVRRPTAGHSPAAGRVQMLRPRAGGSSPPEPRRGAGAPSAAKDGAHLLGLLWFWPLLMAQTFGNSAACSTSRRDLETLGQ